MWASARCKAAPKTQALRVRVPDEVYTQKCGPALGMTEEGSRTWPIHQPDLAFSTWTPGPTFQDPVSTGFDDAEVNRAAISKFRDKIELNVQVPSSTPGPETLGGAGKAVAVVVLGIKQWRAMKLRQSGAPS